ncbi:MAG: hypothetical protein QOF44_4824, partial [Streptomyces sp.]|nr:hypothetical protein [Streptomyces sp.]
MTPVLYTKRARAVLGASLTLTLLAGAGATASVATASASATDPVVLDAAARYVPRATQILNAGATGFLLAQEGDDRLLWTDYATGTTTALATRLPRKLVYDVDAGRFAYNSVYDQGYFGEGSDTVALYDDSPAPRVTLRQGADGGDGTAIPLPDGQSYVGTFGVTVITRTGTKDAPTGYHLLRAESDGVRDTSVTGFPEGWNLATGIEDGDARSVILESETEDNEGFHRQWGIVDLADGALRLLPGASSIRGFRLGHDDLLRLDGPAALLDRNDPDAPARPVSTGSLAYNADITLAGASVVGVEPIAPGDDNYRGQPLYHPAADGESQEKLLAVARGRIAVAPDGSVLVAGAGTSVDRGELDWGIYRFTPAADGTLTRQRIITVDPKPAQIYGLSLGSGILTTADDSTLYAPSTVMGAYRSTWLSVAGRPVAVRTSVDGLVSGRDGDCDETNWRCVVMFASGDGFHGRRRSTESGLTMLRANGSPDWGPQIDTAGDWPDLVDLSGRYAVIGGASSGVTYV